MISVHEPIIPKREKMEKSSTLPVGKEGQVNNTSFLLSNKKGQIIIIFYADRGIVLSNIYIYIYNISV